DDRHAVHRPGALRGRRRREQERHERRAEARQGGGRAAALRGRPRAGQSEDRRLPAREDRRPSRTVHARTRHQSVTPTFSIVTSMSGTTGSSIFTWKSPRNSVGSGAVNRPSAQTVTPRLALSPQIVPPARAQPLALRDAESWKAGYVCRPRAPPQPKPAFAQTLQSHRSADPLSEKSQLKPLCTPTHTPPAGRPTFASRIPGVLM